MSYYCKLCDKTKKIHKNINILNLKIISHRKILLKADIFFSNPNFDKLDEILSKYVNIYNKNMNYMEFALY